MKCPNCKRAASTTENTELFYCRRCNAEINEQGRIIGDGADLAYDLAAGAA